MQLSIKELAEKEEKKLNKQQKENLENLKTNIKNFFMRHPLNNEDYNGKPKTIKAQITECNKALKSAKTLSASIEEFKSYENIYKDLYVDVDVILHNVKLKKHNLESAQNEYNFEDFFDYEVKRFLYHNSTETVEDCKESFKELEQIQKQAKKFKNHKEYDTMCGYIDETFKQVEGALIENIHNNYKTKFEDIDFKIEDNFAWQYDTIEASENALKRLNKLLDQAKKIIEDSKKEEFGGVLSEWNLDYQRENLTNVCKEHFNNIELNANHKIRSIENHKNDLVEVIKEDGATAQIAIDEAVNQLFIDIDDAGYNQSYKTIEGVKNTIKELNKLLKEIEKYKNHRKYDELKNSAKAKIETLDDLQRSLEYKSYQNNFEQKVYNCKSGTQMNKLIAEYIVHHQLDCFKDLEKFSPSLVQTINENCSYEGFDYNIYKIDSLVETEKKKIELQEKVEYLITSRLDKKEERIQKLYTEFKEKLTKQQINKIIENVTNKNANKDQ